MSGGTHRRHAEPILASADHRVERPELLRRVPDHVIHRRGRIFGPFNRERTIAALTFPTQVGATGLLARHHRQIRGRGRQPHRRRSVAHREAGALNDRLVTRADVLHVAGHLRDQPVPRRLVVVLRRGPELGQLPRGLRGVVSRLQIIRAAGEDRQGGVGGGEIRIASHRGDDLAPELDLV